MPVLLQLWDASDTAEPKATSPSKGNGEGGSYGYASSAASRDAVGCAFVADASSFNLHSLAARKRQFDAEVRDRPRLRCARARACLGVGVVARSRLSRWRVPCKSTKRRHMRMHRGVR